jgi:GNAT superfamily N-acetyltransferase
MAEEITLLDPTRHVIGTTKAALCFSLQELTQNFVIHLFEGGLEYYEKEFPYSDFWPVFAFNDIELRAEHRRKGHGTRAFNEIADHYQEMGARLGLLRIGTQGDDFDAGMAWRTKMYSSLGWVVLHHHPDERATIPLMYLPMKARQMTSNESTRFIVVKEEVRLDFVPTNTDVIDAEET